MIATKGYDFWGRVVTLTPLLAALTLVAWEEKGGAKRLLRRYFNSIRLPKMIWYLPTILFLPAIWIFAQWLLSLFRELPEPPQSGALALIVVFIKVLVSGSTEEIAWMGYAYDSLQDKWKTIRATLILALVWIVWHLPVFSFLQFSVMFTVAFSILMVAWRFLIVWIYESTGKSIFAASLFHAMGNVALSLTSFMAAGNLGVMIAGAVTIITALIVAFLCGPELNKFRWSR